MFRRSHCILSICKFFSQYGFESRMWLLNAQGYFPYKRLFCLKCANSDNSVQTKAWRKQIHTSNWGLPRAVSFTAQNPVQSVASGKLRQKVIIFSEKKKKNPSVDSNSHI